MTTNITAEHRGAFGACLRRWRTFAHRYNTGGMLRTHLRKHNNILKRLLVTLPE